MILDIYFIHIVFLGKYEEENQFTPVTGLKNIYGQSRSYHQDDLQSPLSLLLASSVKKYYFLMDLIFFMLIKLKV